METLECLRKRQASFDSVDGDEQDNSLSGQRSRREKCGTCGYQCLKKGNLREDRTACDNRALKVELLHIYRRTFHLLFLLYKSIYTQYRFSKAGHPLQYLKVF